MIFVSTNYKVNLLHGATLAGVDSGFSTFFLSWESQGLRAWASPPESLHPIPTRSPKSTYIYLSHSPNDCHSPTASEKQEKTLERERENGLKMFEAFFWSFWSIDQNIGFWSMISMFHLRSCEEISVSCDITRRPWSVAMDRCVTTGSRIFALRRCARFAEVSVSGGFGSEPAGMTTEMI